jgi:hypothetical protein
MPFGTDSSSPSISRRVQAIAQQIYKVRRSGASSRRLSKDFFQLADQQGFYEVEAAPCILDYFTWTASSPPFGPPANITRLLARMKSTGSGIEPAQPISPGFRVGNCAHPPSGAVLMGVPPVAIWSWSAPRSCRSDISWRRFELARHAFLAGARRWGPSVRCGPHHGGPSSERRRGDPPRSTEAG